MSVNYTNDNKIDCFGHVLEPVLSFLDISAVNF